MDTQHIKCWWTLVYGDGQEREKWTRYYLCPMRYNRLVLFRTHLWHSHNFNFGTTMENGRLVQLFFFNPLKEAVNENISFYGRTSTIWEPY